MLSVNIDAINGIAIVEPHAALSKTDFEQAKKIIDPYIEANGQLNGLIIYTQSFPGWDSFAALSGHLEFVKEHHKKIAHVALVTDSMLGNFAESIASHFINADIESFPYADFEQAKLWIIEASKI
jgi:hypothetical protein